MYRILILYTDYLSCCTTVADFVLPFDSKSTVSARAGLSSCGPEIWNLEIEGPPNFYLKQNSRSQGGTRGSHVPRDIGLRCPRRGLLSGVGSTHKNF